jgi:Flp pilus assembly protein TadG
MKDPVKTSARRARSRRYFADRSGAAAVEFAMWLAVIAYPLLNVIDLGLYVFRTMEVGNAAQMSVQAVYNACSQGYSSPYATNCSANLSAAETDGAHSTSLGTAVSVTDTSECLNGTVTSGSQTTCPTTSGAYIAVTVSYTYVPMFSRASITSLLDTTVTRTDWTRMS